MDVAKNKRYGQFWTPKIVADFMVRQVSKDKSCEVIDPCSGKGVFLNSLREHGFKNITAYEIDDSLPNESPVRIRYQDFLAAEIQRKYDVAIGNPPYSRWKNIPQEIKLNFHQNRYWQDKINGLSDLLYAFIYRCVDNLKQNGELIFITPTFWLQTLHATPLREFLLENGSIRKIVSFNEMKVCEGVSTMFMIFKYIKGKNNEPIEVVQVRSKKKVDEATIGKVEDLFERLNRSENNIRLGVFRAFLHPQLSSGNPWWLIPPDVESTISTIEEACREYTPKVSVNVNGGKVRLPLSKLYERDDLRARGLSTSFHKKVKFSGKTYYTLISEQAGSLDFSKFSKEEPERYIRLGDIAEIGNGLVSGLDKSFRVDDPSEFSKKERKKFLPVIKARNLKRYSHEGITFYIFVNDIKREQELKRYPNIYRQLKEYKEELKNRYNYERNIPWWHWVFLRNWDLIKYNSEKIFTPCKERIDTKGYARFAYVNGEYYATQDVTVIVKNPEFRFDSKYLVGLLNSDTLFTWMREKGLRRGGVLEFSERPLSRIPIRIVDWDNSEEVKIHGDIVRYVNKILERGNIGSDSKKIEKHVRELYGLA